MTTQKTRLRFHSIEIVAAPDGCPAAKGLKQVRILSKEAPRLPLADCDRPHLCDCKYRHHDDRRAGPRRAGEKGALARPWAYTDRRRQRGRRDVDFE